MSFGKNLKEIRQAMGWTQERIAALAQVPPSSIAHFESGAREPSHKTLLRLSDAIHVSLDWLCRESEEETEK